jgi:protein-tyrosine phosphatase
VIDIHSHILPGLDDGPEHIDESLLIARMAAYDGARTILATPHVREDYPYALDEIGFRTRLINERLSREGISIEVVPGAEVAITRVGDLDDRTLAGLCLGKSKSILVESPYGEATEVLENTLFNLQVRGFRPVLAHPERCPAFMKGPERLAELVGRGVLCSATAGSMAGRFGRTVQRFTRLLFERGLVHNVASDAHDAQRRPPGLQPGFRILDRDLPGLLDHMGLFTSDVPEAILAGEAPPTPPALRAPRSASRLRRRGR